MKIFFALALVNYFTWSVVLGDGCFDESKEWVCRMDIMRFGCMSYLPNIENCKASCGLCNYDVNVVEENASGVGGWGGTCQCPDGTTYEVGDNKDGCETLACVNGEKLDCNERDGDWSNRKVTCSDPWILEETGKYCPDAISFPNWGSNAFSLGECKTHCEADGAETLTFYPDNTNCRCCTASSELLESSSSDSQIYTAIQYKLESYEDCTDDSECASNYCYSFTGRCTNRGDIGDSCFWKGDCASGNCKNNRCADNSGIGKCTCF